MAYLRTATADQRGARISLESQYRACEQYAHALGLRVTTIYVDIGASGLAEHRPALDQLLRDLSDGGICRVVMADRARLARSSELERRLHERISGAGADISSPCDSRQLPTERRIDADTDPSHT